MELYFALGILVCLLYTVAIASIVLLFRWKSKTKSSTLGDLRHKLDSIQKDIQDVEGRVWNYGSNEEERGRRWRIACTALAGKAVTVLQSCWMEKDDNSTSQAVYDELLLSLKSVGVEELIPRLGEEVKEDDRRYRVNDKKGAPPYKIEKVVYPGYYFRPTAGNISDQDKVLLEPALVDVLGVTSIIQK